MNLDVMATNSLLDDEEVIERYSSDDVTTYFVSEKYSDNVIHPEVSQYADVNERYSDMIHSDVVGRYFDDVRHSDVIYSDEESYDEICFDAVKYCDPLNLIQLSPLAVVQNLLDLVDFENHFCVKIKQRLLIL